MKAAIIVSSKFQCSLEKNETVPRKLVRSFCVCFSSLRADYKKINGCFQATILNLWHEWNVNLQLECEWYWTNQYSKGVTIIFIALKL